MFWDSSALVPLLLPEARSKEMTTIIRSSATPVFWWATPVECKSAIYRRHREEPLPRAMLETALQRLELLLDHSDTVTATEDVRRRAGRLLAVHPLRAADSLQLAAALVFCEDDPMGESFVCLDRRLRDAGLSEGFQILPREM